MKIFWLYHIPFLLLLSIFFSCENEDSLIGENFLNTNEHDIFIFNDSLIDIVATSHIEDSVNAQSSLSLLGSYLDPVFGQTDAGFCFQITLPNNDMEFNAQTITNIELNIPYVDFYGDSLSEFNVSISQLNESINSSDSTEYYSNQIFTSNLITNTNPVSLSEIRNTSMFSMQLPTSFGLNEILNLSSEALSDNGTFVETFNGFKLEVEPINSINGAIFYLNSGSEEAALSIEYVNLNGETDSVDFALSSGVRLNHFAHNYTESNVTSVDTLLFLQSMGGVFSEIDFSFLENLQDSGYIVNEAELIFSIFNDNELLVSPERITLVESDEGELISIAGLSGGILNNDNDSYSFDITQHLQKIITNGHNPICRLYTYSRTSNAERVILNNTESNPIQLKLVLIKG